MKATLITPTSIVPLLLCLVVVVDGWGKEGHEVVANIAYRLLTDEAQQQVKDILHMDASPTNVNDAADDDYPQTPLGLVADWADRVKYTHEYHWSAPLHFIDIRDDEIPGGCHVDYFWSASSLPTAQKSSSCQFEYQRDCAKDWCVAGAIVNYTQRVSSSVRMFPSESSDSSFSLRKSIQPRSIPYSNNDDDDASSPRTTNETQVSLMFLTHFLGDIHQPLHCARTTDLGGNTISVGFHNQKPMEQAEKQQREGFHRLRDYSIKSGWNLHSVWDSGMITKSVTEMHNGSQVSFEGDVFQALLNARFSGELEEWLTCPDGANVKCVTQWSQESWTAALTYAYADENNNEIVPGTVLSDEYYQSRLPVIQKLLAKAAARLAFTLLLAFGDNKDKDSGTSNRFFSSLWEDALARTN